MSASTRLGLASAAVAVVAGATPAMAVEATRSVFGRLPDGRPVASITLANGRGTTATIIAYGASLQSLVLPDRSGRREDVTLGYPRIDDYVANPQYFGATVGRVANRIANARFRLDGRTYETARNNGPNSLHGGLIGFDKVLWDVVEVSSGPGRARVILRYVSPDGEEGYPGKLTVTATYTLDAANALGIEYRASTDRTTVVNITNHTYWNLAGEGSPRGALDQLLTMPAEAYLPVGATLIPTGERRRVDGTAFDFRAPQPIGKRVREARDPQIAFGRGYDHNWIVAERTTATLHLTARLADPTSGRSLELWSNQPGVQFYSGNFLDGTTVGRTGRLYRQGDAVALEPQTFPDAVNQPAFPTAKLEPGQEYLNRMEYRFAVRRAAGRKK